MRIPGSSASPTPSPGYRTAWACATCTCSSAPPAGRSPRRNWSSSPPPARPVPRPRLTTCTTLPEPAPTRSSTSRPGPPTGGASPPSTRTWPRPNSGTTPNGPAACAPRKISWSVSSPPRPASAAGHGASVRNPNVPGSTSPAPSGPRSPGSATVPRPPPPTSTRPSGPAPAAPTPRPAGKAGLPAGHRPLRVGHHGRHGLGELLLGAELDELRAGLGRGDVPRGYVEGVAHLVGFLAVGVADGDLPGEQVSPVRALAAVSRQPAQQRGQRVAFGDGHEVHRGVVQVAAPVDGRADLLDVRCAVLAETGHGVSCGNRGNRRHDGNRGAADGA